MNAGHHLERTDPVAHDGAAEATDYRYSEDEGGHAASGEAAGSAAAAWCTWWYVNAEAEAAAEGETLEALGIPWRN